MLRQILYESRSNYFGRTYSPRVRAFSLFDRAVMHRPVNSRTQSDIQRCPLGRGAGRLRWRGWTAVAAASLVVVAASGCRSHNLKPRSMPLELQAPLSVTSTSINLERMGSEGARTSHIVPGDLVSLTIVSGSPDERVTPIPMRVGQDGSIMVPLVGPVVIGDMDPVSAERHVVAAAIERGIYKQPAVTLTVTEQATNRITVLGAVSKPGVVELPRGSCDLATALAAAGGLATNAGTQVEILHRGAPLATRPRNGNSPESSQEIQLTSLTEPVPSNPNGPLAMVRIDLSQAGTDTTQNQRLDDRDVVNVLPQEKRLVHVTGLVRKPDQFELARDKDIRVLDAIAMAGGTTSAVADKVYVIRKLRNMDDPAVIEVSISRAKRDGDENLRLAEGDLVSVEETMSTMTVDTISKFFRVALGLNGSVAAF